MNIHAFQVVSYILYTLEATKVFQHPTHRAREIKATETTMDAKDGHAYYVGL